MLETRSGETDLVVVWSTWPDAATAETAGRGLVEARLAACAVVQPGATSVYRWQGKIETASEAVMWVKTRAARAASVEAAIAAAHPYEVPAILVLPVTAAARAYGDWVLAETDPA